MRKTLLATSLLVASASAFAAPAEISETSFIVVTDSSMVRASAVSALKTALPKATVKTLKTMPDFSVVRIPEKASVKAAMQRMSAIPGVTVYPDYKVHALASSSVVAVDPMFSELWGLDSSYDFDINAPEAWNIQTGSADVVIGIIDTGIDYTHPDLQANVWVNPREVPGNGIDDDNNGWVDDIYGIDTANGDSDPFDDGDHGSHVAGTIGAAANNGEGVTGIAWNTKMIGCKFLDIDGFGTESGAIECLDYFLDLKNSGVNIVATNNSWGGGFFNQPLLDAIEAHNDAGILFIAAAGNESNNNDTSPSYPASYDVDNIISVAAHDEFGTPADFTNYGPQSVDISAPGVDILSTVPGPTYELFSGTSMATPHVTGAVALMAAQYPDMPAHEIKTLLLNSAVYESNLSSYVGYGRLQLIGADGSGALNCIDQTSYRSLQSDELSVESGTDVTLLFGAYNCMTSVSTLSVLSNGVIYPLSDDGQGADAVAGDGVFSLPVTANWNTTRTFTVLADNGDLTNAVVSVTTYTMPELTEIPFEYVDISGQSINLYLGDDSATTVSPGFPVMLPDNSTADSIYVSSNGFIGLDGNGTASFGNTRLPANINSQAVYLHWSDLNPGSGGAVQYAVVGTAPERKLVIEYADVPPYGDTGGMTFQIVLQESSPTVMMNYLDVTSASSTRSNGANATIGYELDGNALQFGYNEAVLRDQMSLKVGSQEIDPLAPVITEFRVSSGVFRPELPIGFSGTAEAPPEAPDATVELAIDFGDGVQVPYEAGTEAFSGFPIGLQRATLFATAGEVTVSRSVEFVIYDYTSDEQELMGQAYEQGVADVVTDPAAYGLISSLADAADIIRQNPEVYGLAPVVNTPETLAALPAGKYLLGTPVDITNMYEYFGNAKYIITYKDGVNYGWSRYQGIRDIMVDRGYTIINQMDAGMGYWLYQ